MPGANEDMRFGVGGASTGRSGDPVGGPKPCQMHRRSYKNRCWRCLCKSFAENAYNMRPGSAVRSKCKPLVSVFGGSDTSSVPKSVRDGVQQGCDQVGASIERRWGRPSNTLARASYKIIIL